MITDTYLILRVTGTGQVSFDPFGGFERGPGTLGAPEAFEFQVDTQELSQADYRDVQHDPQVTAAAPVLPLHLIQPFDAPELSAETEHIHGATWGVFVTGALQSPYVGHGVTVAVLDTGIDAGHEAFRGMELVQHDFTGEGDGDLNGHGTHVAGTIFGQTAKGGVRYGVAPGVRRALIGKVIGKHGGASTQGLAQAIQWATDNGAQIINMSLGFDFPGWVKLLTEKGMAVDLATSKALAQYRDNVRLFDQLMGLLRAQSALSPGALVIAAAGNESKRKQNPNHAIEVALPAAANGIVSVAALGSAGPPHDVLTVAPFSNIGATVAAPGVDVYSVQPGGDYTVLSGTSMASPHAAGVAALWAEYLLKQRGVINIGTLADRLRGKVNINRLQQAPYQDVGEGLVAAPTE